MEIQEAGDGARRVSSHYRVNTRVVRQGVSLRLLITNSPNPTLAAEESIERSFFAAAVFVLGEKGHRLAALAAWWIKIVL